LFSVFSPFSSFFLFAFVFSLLYPTSNFIHNMLAQRLSRPLQRFHASCTRITTTTVARQLTTLSASAAMNLSNPSPGTRTMTGVPKMCSSISINTTIASSTTAAIRNVTATVTDHKRQWLHTTRPILSSEYDGAGHDFDPHSKPVFTQYASYKGTAAMNVAFVRPTFSEASNGRFFKLSRAGRIRIELGT
jgi:hypothetical protein